MTSKETNALYSLKYGYLAKSDKNMKKDSCSKVKWNQQLATFGIIQGNSNPGDAHMDIVERDKIYPQDL